MADDMSLSVSSCTSYKNLGKPPLSIHSWYNSKRWALTQRRGGGDLPIADCVVLCCCWALPETQSSPSIFAPIHTSLSRRRGEMRRGGGR